MGVLTPRRFGAPPIGCAEAAEIAVRHWRLERVVAEEIGRPEERTFRLRLENGEEYALKVAGDAVPRSALLAEHAALRYLAEALDDVAVPRPLPDRDGSEVVEVDGVALRLMSWVPGTTMAALGRPAEADAEGLGATAAEAGRALAGFDAPGRRSSQWDARIAVEVVEAIGPRLEEADRAELWRALAPLREARAWLDHQLPQQTIHGGVTDANVVGSLDAEGRFRITGLIDLGELVHTWRICDPAASIVAVIAASPVDPLDATLAVLRGYLGVVQLKAVEIDALWPTVLARAAVCLASSRLRACESPRHDGARATLEADREALRRALSVPVASARAAMREAAG